MEKIWLSEYQNDVAETINPDKYSNITELFNESCQQFAEKVAYSNFGTEITYRELNKKANAFAAYLQEELKLNKGDKLAIMLPNLLQYPIAMFGALKAGITIVNINPLYTPRELLYQVNDACVETILVMENFAKTVQKVLEVSALKNIIVTRLGDLHVTPKKIIMNFVNKHIKKNVPKFKIPGKINFNDIIKKGANLKTLECNSAADDIAFLQYTGGTTGVAKGAMLSHRNLLANLAQGQEWVKPSLRKGKEIIVTPLPLYHIFSLTANCLMFIAMGAKNVLITNPKDIPAFIKELKNLPFTVMTGVNTLFNALLGHHNFSKLDFSNLRLSLGGGMSVQRGVAEKWQKVTNCPLLEAYGLTEASPAVAINPMNLESYNGSIGLPLPSTDVSIRDQDGNEMKVGEAGELWIKGPQVMLGYWQKPEETSKVFEDGWLKTGDVAYIDSKGYIFIVDRLKDMILVSGFNVYPNEVEEAIASHPMVNEVGVVGVKNSSGNEMVVAYVSLNNKQQVNEAELKRHCLDNLTRYKVPKRFVFLDELPKTNVGKISRKDLKKLSVSN